MQSTGTREPGLEGAPGDLASALRLVRSALANARSWLSDASVRSWDEEALLDAQRELNAGKRDAEVVLAAVCAEIGRRSAPEFGAGGMARKRGFTDPGRLIATQNGTSRREAESLIRAGQMLADADEVERAQQAEAFGGPEGSADGARGGEGADAAGDPGREALGAADEPSGSQPVAYARVAAALRDGRISVAAASAITAMLGAVRGEAGAERVVIAERKLVDAAERLSMEQLNAVIRRHKRWLQAHEVEARQARMVDERSVMVREESDGSVQIWAKLDPVSAAPVRAVLDSIVKSDFRRRRDGDELADDKRTPPQMRADALVTMAKHFMGCDEAPLAHATTKVMVRIGLQELLTGVGMGEIDGTESAIPAGELRRMGVEAEYLPVVLGGESQLLDLGRTRREFSAAQRDALLERDAGCAMCGRPPSHCEAHHIEWWSRGGTSDLSNGVMLCVACHHTVHNDGWRIEASPDDVWFVPPPDVDPERRPRLGGRARFGVTGATARVLSTAAQP